MLTIPEVLVELRQFYICAIFFGDFLNLRPHIFGDIVTL
jgi:hypothetical protein